MFNQLESIWLGRWKSRKITNKERMEKWGDKKDFSFSNLCLVGRVEKWRDENFFCLIENKVCINLLLYPY